MINDEKLLLLIQGISLVRIYCGTKNEAMYGTTSTT